MYYIKQLFFYINTHIYNKKYKWLNYFLHNNIIFYYYFNHKYFFDIQIKNEKKNYLKIIRNFRLRLKWKNYF